MSRRREQVAAEDGPRRQLPGVRGSSSERSERVEGGEEMLTEEGIGGRVTGVDAVAGIAVAAVTGEEAERAAPWWRLPRIDEGEMLLAVEGTS